MAEADLDESACDVAVTVTCGGFGMVAGAVYMPPMVTVPFNAPPVTPHVTDVFAVPETFDLNCWVLLTMTFAEGGRIVTETGTGGADAPDPPPQPPSTESRKQDRREENVWRTKTLSVLECH